MSVLPGFILYCQSCFSKVILTVLIGCILKKNLNASRPPEHPPVREKNIKPFTGRWDHIGCKNQASPWRLNGFPDGSNIGSTA